MLEKHYPLTVIGKSYLSLIYGIELLRYFDRILILDDDRLSFGDLYETGLTQVDFSFLQTFGIDRDIAELKEGKFFHQKPYYLHCDNTQAYLGRDPWSNLLELYRKFETLFPYDFVFNQQDVEDEAGLTWNAESFNNDYRIFCDRLGVSAFRFKSIENFNFEYLIGHCPESIKFLFRLFSKQVSVNPELSQALLYYGRTLFHKRLTTAYSQLELFHFFICIIGPYYDLDSEALSRCLSTRFIGAGGHLKSAHVREWKFYKQNPWSIELSSFEGIIHPQKISFLGTHPSGLPLKIKHKGQTYRTVHFTVAHRDQRLFLCDDSWHVIGHHRTIGTDYPILKVRFEDNQIIGQYLYREKNGSKLDFYKDGLERFLATELECFFPGIGESLDRVQFSQGREVYLDQSDRFNSESMLKLNQVSLYDFSEPTHQYKLKNVSYFGPLKGGPLGVIGQLLELKEVPKYQ